VLDLGPFIREREGIASHHGGWGRSCLKEEDIIVT
jgi:hypothetical protein